MSKRKIYALSYFLGRVFFLGFAFSLLLNMNDKDSWICFLFGTLLGCIFIFFISKIKENIKGKTLKEYLNQNKIMKYPILLILFFLNLFILIQILTILETFASSFFLISSPPFFILLPVVFLIYRITKKGWKTIGRIGEIFMPLSLVFILLTGCMLISDVKIEHFLPILTSKPYDLITGTIFFAFYSSSPFILLLDAPMKETKLVRKYLFSIITIILSGVVIIGVLGPNLIKVYRFPEYMVLKRIKAFNFLEKIENLISITWIIDLLMVPAIAGNNIKDILPQKGKNILFGAILLFSYFIILLLGKMYKIELQIYYILPITLGAFEIILIMLFLIFHFITKKKKETSKKSNE